jgi:hypothetical protein
MYLKTENLQALVNGHELNLYQKSLAKKELERLLTLLKDTEEAITVTRCCKSDSELLPSFLSKRNNKVCVNVVEDADVTEHWNDYLKTR